MGKHFKWMPVIALFSLAGYSGIAASARDSTDAAPAAVGVAVKIVAPTKVENFSKDYENELMSLRDKPAEQVAPTF